MFKNYLIVFLVSMLPLIELRGAIPIAESMNLNIWVYYIVAIIGNMIPVPFIYLFKGVVQNSRPNELLNFIQFLL